MSDVIFFKLYSNLGVLKKPNRQKERNDSVYYGPDAITSGGFLQDFPDAQVYEFRFSQNAGIKNDAFYKKLIEEMVECRDYLLSRATDIHTLVAIGGDNSIVFPALLSDMVRFGSESFGIITFDTHGDIHLNAESPTGNFHGLYLRPFFDTFDVSELDELVPSKLKGEDLLYFGNFDFEQEEIDFMNKKNIRRFSSREIRDSSGEIRNFLQEYLAAHTHIFINFDIDVFDESLVEATGIRNKNGLLRDEVFPLLEIIRQHASKTISLSEVSPEKKGIDATAQIAREVISALVK